MMSRSKEWICSVALVDSTRTVASCHLPSRLVRLVQDTQQPHHQDRPVVLCVRLLSDDNVSVDDDQANMSQLYITWSGEESQSHVDSIEMPRSYVMANRLFDSHLHEEFVSTGLLRVVVSCVQPHFMRRVSNVTLMPSSIADYEAIAAHKTLVEDTFLQKFFIVYRNQRIVFSVLSDIEASLTVQDVEYESAGEIEGCHDIKPSSLFSAFYNQLVTAVTMVDEAINESSVIEKHGCMIGFLSNSSLVTIALPATEIKPLTDQDACSQNGKCNFSHSTKKLCKMSSFLPLRALPFDFQCKDTSYFGMSATGTSDFLDSDISVSLKNQSVGTDVASHAEDLSDYQYCYCTCIVHPLYFICAEDLALGVSDRQKSKQKHACKMLSNMKNVTKNWGELRLSESINDSSHFAFLGNLEVLKHEWCRFPNNSSDTKPGEINCSTISCIVRVLISTSVRPFHIFISEPTRYTLGVTDCDLVRLSLISPVETKPQPFPLKTLCIRPFHSLQKPSHESLSDVLRISLADLKRDVSRQGQVVLSSRTQIYPRSHPSSLSRYELSFNEHEMGSGILANYIILTEENFSSFAEACCLSLSCDEAIANISTPKLGPSRCSPEVWCREVRSDGCVIPGDTIECNLGDMYGIEELISQISRDTSSLFLPHAVLQRIVSKSNLKKSIPGPLGSLVLGEKGSGKSTLLQGLARSLQSSCRCVVYPIVIKCNDLLNPSTCSLDDITKSLSRIFDDAFFKAPSIICLDDLDILCRGDVSDAESPSHDVRTVYKNEKICDHIIQLLDATKRYNDSCAVSSEVQFKALDEMCCGDVCFKTHGGLFGIDTTEHTLQNCCVPFAPHRVVGRSLHKAVYVLASAQTAQRVHKRILDLCFLGRRIYEIPTFLQHEARASILESALYKLGTPLRFERQGHSSMEILKSDRKRLHKVTEGYKPCDIWALAREIASLVLTRAYDIGSKDQLGKACTISDIIDISKTFSPESDAKVKLEESSSSWDDVGGHDNVKKLLLDSFLRPLLLRKLYIKNKIRFSRGVLLFGPPGTGKTALAKAAGSELGMSLISVRGPELLSKYIGESEKAVRTLFEKAKGLQRPCIIFFDEFEALAPKRGNDNSGGVTDRIVNQLLTFLDGVESTMGSSDLLGGQIFIIAATSRPDMIDSALLRPGRIGKHVYVGLPNEKEKEAILNTHLCRIESDSDMTDVYKAIFSHPQATLMSGADLKGLVNTACMLAYSDKMKGGGLTNLCKSADNDALVKPSHLLEACSQLVPSLSVEDLRFYDGINSKFVPGNVEPKSNESRSDGFVLKQSFAS